ncbi:hypothetical protein CDAR_265421 [Caerostris darwini]|uniref:Endonuclease/exonuclease/phosphatase domain-containing protein n=1 Tax=Caerostris darwini TaxID=1538125 RepID=A0AAV4PDL9_9ARAC|nr:hypothetical protein CDAR_265421 [Caerostris darwini]
MSCPGAKVRSDQVGGKSRRDRDCRERPKGSKRRREMFLLLIKCGNRGLEVSSKTIITGDMNARSRKWGYIHSNATRLKFEDLINSGSLENRLCSREIDQHVIRGKGGSEATCDQRQIQFSPFIKAALDGRDILAAINVDFKRA